MISNFRDALAHFKLNWKVDTRPIFTVDNAGQPLAVEDANAIVRSDIGLPLSVVGLKYTPVQNDATADILDGVLGKTGGEYVRGGMFGMGRKVYLQAQLPDVIRVKDRDATAKLLTFITSHDMTTKVVLGFTATRIVCQNTYMMALKDIRRQVALPHTASVEAKLKTVQEILESQLVYFRQLEVKANWLADQRFTDLQMDLAMRKVLGVKPEATEIPTRTLGIMDTIRGNFQNHDGVGGTAWDAYNAFTKYANHQKGTRGVEEAEQPSRRFESLLFGAGGGFQDDALTVIESQLAA